MAQAQLHLLNIDIEESLWRLDERTIRIGREGLAQARAALAQAARNQLHRADGQDSLEGEPSEQDEPEQQPSEQDELEHLGPERLAPEPEPERFDRAA